MLLLVGVLDSPGSPSLGFVHALCHFGFKHESHSLHVMVRGFLGGIGNLGPGKAWLGEPPGPPNTISSGRFRGLPVSTLVPAVTAAVGFDFLRTALTRLGSRVFPKPGALFSPGRPFLGVPHGLCLPGFNSPSWFLRQAFFSRSCTHGLYFPVTTLWILNSRFLPDPLP